VVALAVAVAVAPLIVVGLALTPVAIARQWCYRASAYGLTRFKWAFRDERPLDLPGNRHQRRRALAVARRGRR
jgi:hypothetical protein